MSLRGVLTGQLAHIAVDLGLKARLTVSAIPQSQLDEETSKKTQRILEITIKRPAIAKAPRDFK